MIDYVMPTNDSRSRARLQNRRQHAQRRRFSRAVCAQQAVNLPRLAAKADAIHRANFAALLIPEMLGKILDFDHSGPLVICREDRIPTRDAAF